VDLRPIDAIHALRERGVDSPESLLQFGTPEQILEACRRWDAREGVGPGLLVRWIRSQEFAGEKPVTNRTAQLRARFDDYAERYPEGAVCEPHARLQARKGYLEDPCPGQLVVIDIPSMAIITECDVCGEEWSYTVRTLHLLGPPGLRAVDDEAVF
jgi:hypothetical protein